MGIFPVSGNMNSKINSELSSLSTAYEKLAFVLVKNDNNIHLASEIIQKEFDVDIINISIELSKLLGPEKETRYPFLVNKKLDEIIDKFSAEILVLRNIELLYEPILKLNVIQSLKNISRQRAIIVFWPGIFEDNYLIYATPAHPEYTRDYIGSLPVFSFKNKTISYLSGGY